MDRRVVQPKTRKDRKPLAKKEDGQRSRVNDPRIVMLPRDIEIGGSKVTCIRTVSMWKKKEECLCALLMITLMWISFILIIGMVLTIIEIY